MAGERQMRSIIRTTTGRSELSTVFSSLYLDGDKNPERVFSPATGHGVLSQEGRRGYRMKERCTWSTAQPTGSGAPAYNTETARFLRAYNPTEPKLLCSTVGLLSLYLQTEPHTGAAALMTGWRRLTSMH